MFNKKNTLKIAILSTLLAGSAGAYAVPGNGNGNGQGHTGSGTVTTNPTPITPVSEITTKAGTSSTFYFTMPNDKSTTESFAGSLTVTQLASGTEWSLSAGFKNAAAKVLDLSFDYSGSANLVASAESGGTTIKGIVKKGIQFDPSGNTLNAGETMTWQFAGTDLSKFSIAELHIGNFLSNGGSIKYATGPYDPTLHPSPVPEPATYAMMAAGLAVVVLLSRRRKAGESGSRTPMSLSAA